MVRTVLAGFVGALIVFLWGALAWQVFGLWSDGVRELPGDGAVERVIACLLYTSPSPRDYAASRMPSSA